MTEKELDYHTILLGQLYDWCEEFIHYYYVSEELSDIGIVNENIEKEWEDAVKNIKRIMDKAKYKGDVEWLRKEWLNSLFLVVVGVH